MAIVATGESKKCRPKARRRFTGRDFLDRQAQFWHQRARRETANGNGDNPDERSNGQAMQHVIARQARDNSALAGGAFDAMLVYLPLPTLLTRMVCAHKVD